MIQHRSEALSQGCPLTWGDKGRPHWNSSACWPRLVLAQGGKGGFLCGPLIRGASCSTASSAPSSYL